MMNRRHFAATLAAATPLLMSRSLGAATGRRSAAGLAPLGDAFLATLPQLMEISSLPGLGIGEVQNGKPANVHFAGVMDTNTKAVISPTTLFPAASLGKPVFAWAVLQLSDEGRLDLNRPLIDYLPPAERPSGERELRITARHVLSHSSGFRNWRQDANEAFASRFEPGTRFLYSGEGYYLLQRCVELITGTGIEQFMRERMDRLGMTGSTYLWRADAMERIAQGHSFFRDNQPTRDYWDFNVRIFELMRASGQGAASWRHEKTLDAARQLGIGLESTAPGVAPEYLWQWGDNGGGIWKNFALVHPASGSAIVAFSNGTYGMRVIERIMRASAGRDLAAFLWVG